MKHFIAYTRSDFLVYIRSDFLADIHSDRRSNPNHALKLNVNKIRGNTLVSGAKDLAECKLQHFLLLKVQVSVYSSMAT